MRSRLARAAALALSAAPAKRNAEARQAIVSKVSAVRICLLVTRHWHLLQPLSSPDQAARLASLPLKHVLESCVAVRRHSSFSLSAFLVSVADRPRSGTQDQPESVRCRCCFHATVNIVGAGLIFPIRRRRARRAVVVYAALWLGAGIALLIYSSPQPGQHHDVARDDQRHEEREKQAQRQPQ